MDVDGRVEYRHRAVCLQRQHDQTSPARQFRQPILSSNGTAEIANAHGLVTGLTPVTFPTLDAGPQATGRSGHQAAITMVIGDLQGATVRFENLTILQQTRLNETLVVTNNPAPPPNPPNNPGPSPPSSGQGSSTSTNTTTRSPISLLTIFRSIIIPVVAGYVGLGLFALVLLIRQERKRSTNGQILGLRFCQSCGTELGVGILTCPSCGLPTEIPRGQERFPTRED